MVLFWREKSVGSFLQILGAGCLVAVVLAISVKHFICFLGCAGARSIASVTTSTSGVLFLA
jgi:hypothetical protein